MINATVPSLDPGAHPMTAGADLSNDNMARPGSSGLRCSVQVYPPVRASPDDRTALNRKPHNDVDQLLHHNAARGLPLNNNIEDGELAPCTSGSSAPSSSYHLSHLVKKENVRTWTQYRKHGSSRRLSNRQRQ